MSGGGALVQLVADEGGQSDYLTGNAPQQQPMIRQTPGFQMQMQGTTEADPTRQESICNRFCASEGEYDKCMQSCMGHL